MAGIEDIAGPCYQFSPVRVQFQSQSTIIDILRSVQRQSAESAAHDFFGFEKIARECAKWPAEVVFFDSVVHHQDFEDFDTMSFADGSCRVEVLNPHGDAALPLKVVSFVRDGRTHVGIVGSEGSSEVVEVLLDNLVGAIQEMANPGSTQLVIDLQGEW
jgi:hypothetical protein